METGGGQAAPRHFIDIRDHEPAELRRMLSLASSFKAAGRAADKPLAGKTLAMIFEKPSTRTRVSFEVGMRQLGGDVVNLTGAEMQLGRGETIADTAKVLSRYVDAIVMRTFTHARLMEMADNATVPVINGLTDNSHSVQWMADVLTV